MPDGITKVICRSLARSVNRCAGCSCLREAFSAKRERPGSEATTSAPPLTYCDCERRLLRNVFARKPLDKR